MNPTREDLLITRIVDRADDPRDWRELDHLTEASSDVWSDLLEALRQDAAVRAAVQPAARVAESVALPVAIPAPAPALEREPVPAAAWSGWLAAVLLAGFWIASTMSPATESAIDEPTTAVVTPAHVTPAPAASAEVLGELSRVVMQARPTEDGSGLEVLYVRRVLERAVVRELYQFSEDEHGTPVPTQVSLAHFDTPSRY